MFSLMGFSSFTGLNGIFPMLPGAVLQKLSGAAAGCSWHGTESRHTFHYLGVWLHFTKGLSVARNALKAVLARCPTASRHCQWYVG